MAKVSTFTVVPKLPKRLAKLRDVAFNMAWCWDPEAVELFYRIDLDLWAEVTQNPVALLGRVSQARLEELAEDVAFTAHLDRVSERLEDYIAAKPWQENNPDSPKNLEIAYFSAEFGIHESVSIYSGGLGVLAGDHLKSASDLGLPLVAVGMLYGEGYHRQAINADGWQQERYPRNDFYNMPLELVLGKDGKPLTVDVDLPGRKAHLRVWKLLVGRVKLFLLDSDFDANDQDDREITSRLYGGDRDMRIRQEIVLGMGGVKALHAMGIFPSIYHMNEGHSAFMVLQRISDLIVEEKLNWDDALESVKSASVFTTHTPVPAGNDMFLPEMIERYFSDYCKKIKLDMRALLALGKQNPEDEREPFCMTVLAIKISSATNGVSKLHGAVARGMWSRTFRGVPEDEVPITSITNGIHVRTVVSRELGNLYERYLGPNWVADVLKQEVWDAIDKVPDDELWRTHAVRRERLVAFARAKLHAAMKRRGASGAELHSAQEVLDPEALTIGFARRFATYKRASLFLRNPERFLRIMRNTERPIQLILAGKAHPQDNEGKELIRSIIHFLREHDLRNQIVFLEDYDMNVARYMVQGVDCWLNTPRRPMEASGTSGMKASANGALNISISDGWWCEAEDLGPNGWTIGAGEEYDNPEEQDYFDSESLYDILEHEVTPLFYERGRDGLPRPWIHRMKAAIRTCTPVFNTHRMVQEYADRFYIPATVRRNNLRADNRARSNALAQWKKHVRDVWGKVSFIDTASDSTEGLEFGSRLTVRADLFVGDLSEKDVTVELYVGPVDAHGRIPRGVPVPMEFSEDAGEGVKRFTGAIDCERTGRMGYMVRVVPNHPDLAHKHETALITWA